MQRTFSLPDDLVMQIEATAALQGKNLDEWLEKTLRANLEREDWSDLLAYGRQKGVESGYTEQDVPQVVEDWRRDQRGRS